MPRCPRECAQCGSSWRNPTCKPLRDTFRGIQKGARVHIRGTKVRSSMNATVTALLEPNAIRCRSDRNGGEYTVLLSDCRRLSRAPKAER